MQDTTTDRHQVTGTRITSKPTTNPRGTAFEVKYANRWVKVWTRTVAGGSPQMGIKSAGAFVPLDSDTVRRLAVHTKRGV